MTYASDLTGEAPRPISMEEHRQLGRENERRKRTAVNDALQFPTGDQFEADLNDMLGGDAESSGDVIVIALIDCDEFLQVNQEFGHDVGDRVLIETGRYIRRSVPEEAKVYRIGGDEFGLIFRGEREREEVFLLLNELRQNYAVKTPDGVAQTITVGMATAFEDASRCAELIRKADGALYRAKAAGRNRIAMAKEEKMTPKTSHYPRDQLQRLSKLSKREGVGEAILLREALDMLLKKYDI